MKISDAEWYVMEIVWQTSPLSASEIIQKLKTKHTTSWSDKTIRTLIYRLVQKGALDKKKKKINVYTPLIAKEDCIEEETYKFMKKMYDNSLGLLVSNFVKNNKLSEEDINALKDILEKNQKS